MKKILLVTGIAVILLGLFFYPKQGSSHPTEFFIQQRIRQGISEQEAREGMTGWTCKCIGIEKGELLTSYTTTKICYGIVLNCTNNK